MSRESGRKKQPASNDLPWILLGGFLVLVIAVVLIVWLGAQANPETGKLPSSDPLGVISALIDGSLVPAVPQLFATGALLLILIASVVAAIVLFMRYQRTRSRVDNRSKSMAQARDLVDLFEDHAIKDAERLGAAAAGPGVTLASHVGTGRKLYASWEWVQIWLMGPRAGKTSCVCVPQIIETAGPVLATSNKRDIVDLSRGPRSQLGVVWVHDVQDIIGEAPSWWWNPLSFVNDIETASKITDIFITSATSAGSKQDAYFESAGKETLARMFLAAALGRRSIEEVFRWGNNPDPTSIVGTVDPAKLLAEHGEIAHAEALRATQNLTPKQRDGVYGTLRPWIGILGSRKVLPWITDNGTNRPQFDPEKFASSTDTIYLISKEGDGSARAITGALTMAILTAAERLASRQAGGRLSTPLMGVLDEAANVCRWRELPDVYSHYGSRGIILSTYFQSYAQGIEAYGENGMSKLWSAANIRVAGAGLSEERFLPFLSNLIGDHDVVKRSSSSQTKDRSVTTSVARERIFDVSDLTSLPRGRAIMLASGMPAALIKLDHYSTRPYGNQVAQSKAYFEARATVQSAITTEGLRP